MGKFKAVYNSTTWKRLRDLKLTRNPICEYCHKRPATDVDHFRPLRDGVDPYAWDNLRSACAQCHRLKTRNDERVVGCDAQGVPLDPRHPWNRVCNLHTLVEGAGKISPALAVKTEREHENRVSTGAN